MADYTPEQNGQAADTGGKSPERDVTRGVTKDHETGDFGYGPEFE